MVRVLDRIRFEIDDDRSTRSSLGLPVNTRGYTVTDKDHVEFRLTQIHAKYQNAHRYFAEQIEHASKDCFGMASGNKETLEVYWDFEAFLNAVTTSLDILARVVGTSYIEQTPPSFSKLCKKGHLPGCADILRAAQSRWVSRMKDYRDCFVHYTSVDTLFLFSCNLYSNGFEVRASSQRTPTFEISSASDSLAALKSLKYAIHVYRQLQVLDKRIARQIATDYERGEFPKRKDNLFFLGTRNR